MSKKHEVISYAQGAPVRPGEGRLVALQHPGRSFDPCMI